MKHIVASFTEGERRIIVFVLITFAVGYFMVEWRQKDQSRLVFTTAQPFTGEAHPGMPRPLTPRGMDPAGKVDINTADAQLLETLPGIGPSLAADLLRHRETAGPFRSMEDLDKVPGIGPAKLSKLAPAVTFGESAGAGAPAAVTSALPAPATGAINTLTQQPSGTGAVAARININTATAEQLDALNGVGPALANRIVEDRRQNGPFRTAADLDRVKGVGASILQKNAALISVD